jgi:glycosyltransferase involved in cell wall biosynthesis
MESEEKEQVKAIYTEGKEYFLFTGNIYPEDQLLVLLKAFSQFKKWQLSNMKLVLAGATNKKTARLKEKLATYKYREDVVILENPSPELITNLLQAAYAPVYIDKSEEELARHLSLLYKDESFRKSTLPGDL